MADTDDLRNLHFDKQLQRPVRDDGHTMLLLETGQNLRTFSDYPNLTCCLDNILLQYEEFRDANNLPKEAYTIEHLWDWIDQFKTMDLFIFDQDLARYKQTSRNEMKQLFIQQIRKLDEENSSQQSSEQKGTNNRDKNSGYRRRADSDEDENWD